ncbi:zinc metalloproteinase-disintegrin-like batroxstatin-1 [Trichomycterus rosablanca]|uniref:zinc metalloproteinase-disintegrin-like batroxstatin-1 n=1 Tax=Trichomycterus rosablanca TaxID=2290929 RepID=UPI002F35321F
MHFITQTALFFFFMCDLGCFTELVPAIGSVDQYDVVRPRRLSIRRHRSTPEQTFNTERNKQGKYPEELWYHLYFDGNNHTIYLKKNSFLMGHNYTEVHYGVDGSAVITSSGPEDHCYYHGHIQGINDSSVSVGVCSGIRGFVRAKEQMYLIEPLSDNAEGDHAIYKQESLKLRKRSPDYTGLDRVPRMVSLFKRSLWNHRSPFETQRYVELFLVVDNTEFRRFGSKADVVRARMLEAVNHIDKFYRPQNIRVMLVGLELWTAEDQILVSLSIDDTLTRFTEWRKTDLLKRIKHDNAQFVTGIDFLGDAVGLANKFAMCGEGSAAVNQDHNTSPLGLAATIAHEMGHNMGMSHDEPGCTCGQSDCIMTESLKDKSSVFPELFSDCSLDQLTTYLENADSSCLLDPPKSDRLYGGPVCGNAVLDLGEDCDCGTVEECDDPCCNAATCKLTPGSQCAEGKCCENCQIKRAGSVCRVSVNECDLDEFCTGLSEKCPDDSFKMNGMPCSSGNNYCYNGQCPTHLQHCQRLWGKDASVAVDGCFFRNLFGRNDSHCGRTETGYRPCAMEDRFCGTIYCSGGRRIPVTGLKATLMFKNEMCKIAGEISQSGNISMVPTGTKCGHDKVCYENMCQDVTVYGTSQDCSLKCNNHGVCDHRAQCHCDPGWAPPYCDTKYADLPSGKSTVVGVSVAAVFLILAAALGGWMYCKKRTGTGSRNQKNDHPAQQVLLTERPEISEPVFKESTANQPCTPLPPRPPPQPPNRPHPAVLSPSKKKPPPPSPPPQVSKPPVPAVQPAVASGSWRKQETAGDEVKLTLSENFSRR